MNGLTKAEVLIELAKGSKLTTDGLSGEYIHLTKEGIVYANRETVS